MAGDYSAARNVKRDILINELDLKQVSNTTIFLEGKYFVLSPSVQNSYNWFDLRLVNLKQFDRKNQKGYLLIRFFDKFLLADLRAFIRSMVSKDNNVKTKVSGVHWKFNIRHVNGQYIIINQRGKMQFIIEEVTQDELKQKLGRVSKKTISAQKVTTIKDVDRIQNEEVRLTDLREKITLLNERTMKPHVYQNPNARHESMKPANGLVHWFLTLFRRR
ncbi:hypothetical protein [Neobacillus vireti]|uniref:hypothetical protein n=1 Tax=Neobacillus vireti TaxID=220686 RepID=UPI002FFE2FAA